MAGRHWTEADVGDLSGQRMLVTGGNSGIGREAVRIFAEHGAAVLLACRSTDKGAAVARSLAGAPGEVTVVELDLADLTSVAAAADRVLELTGHLDVLCNNAGVMATPERTTADGFELQLGTNHLGHFALTAQLLPLLLDAPAPRVVTVSSTAHRLGSIDVDDLRSPGPYRPWRAYGRSKLANLLFTAELQRRSDEAEAGLLAVAAHPGYAATNLQAAGPEMAGSHARALVSRAISNVLGQSPAMGALPIVFAAVSPEVRGDDYIGPKGLAEARGHPGRVGRSDAAKDSESARRLWDVSAELTGVEPKLPSS